ncbi:MAG: desulfoferrodoxin [Planctomycetota bacterium]
MVDLKIYKCNICGNVVELVHASKGQLVCCGQPMELMQEKTEDAGKEKHVPVVEKAGNAYKVKVGSVPHPMEEKHYIEWAQLLGEGRACRKFLKPGQTPEVEFAAKSDTPKIRIFCNIHGLWKADSRG